MRESRILEHSRWEFLTLERTRLENIYSRAKSFSRKTRIFPTFASKVSLEHSSSEKFAVNQILNSNKSNEEKYLEFYDYLLQSEKYDIDSSNFGLGVFRTNNKKEGSKIFYRGGLEKSIRGNLVKNGFAISMGANQVINIRTLKRDKNGSYQIDGEITQLFPNGYIVKGEPLLRTYKGDKRTKGKQQRNIRNESFEIDFTKNITFSKKYGEQFIGKVNAKVQVGNQTPIKIEEVEGTLIEEHDGFSFEAKYPPNLEGLMEGSLVTSYGVEARGSFDENYTLQGHGLKQYSSGEEFKLEGSWFIEGTWLGGQPVDREKYHLKFGDIELDGVYQDKEKRFWVENANISQGNISYQGSLTIPLELKQQNPKLRFNEYFQDLKLKPESGSLLIKKDKLSSVKFDYAQSKLLDSYELIKDTKSIQEYFSKTGSTRQYLESLDLRDVPKYKLNSFFQSRDAAINHFESFQISDLNSLGGIVSANKMADFATIKDKILKEVKSVIFLMQNTKLENRIDVEGHRTFDLKNGYLVKQYQNGLCQCTSSNGDTVLSFRLGADGEILSIEKNTLKKRNQWQCLIYEKQASDEQIFVGSKGGLNKEKLLGLLLKPNGEHLKGIFGKSKIDTAINVHGKYKQYRSDGESRKVKYLNGLIDKSYSPIDKAYIKKSLSEWYSAKLLPQVFLFLMLVAMVSDTWENYAFESSLKEFPVSLEDRERMIKQYETLSPELKYEILKNISKMFYLKDPEGEEYQKILKFLYAYTEEQKAYHNTVVVAEFEGMDQRLPGKIRVHEGLLIPYRSNRHDSQLQYVREFVKRSQSIRSLAKKKNIFFPDRKSIRENFAKYKSKFKNK